MASNRSTFSPRAAEPSSNHFRCLVIVAGCGSSKSANTVRSVAQIQRDEDDLTLEDLELLPCKIPEFDTAFEQINEHFSQLVHLNNAVTDRVVQVKQAHAASFGAFKVQTLPATCTDRVLLDLLLNTGQAGARPSSDDIKKLVSLPSVRAADVKLGQAVEELHEYLAQRDVQTFSLMSSKGYLTHRLPPLVDFDHDLPLAPKQVTAVNGALEKLRAQLGDKFNLVLLVKPTAAFGAQIFYSRLLKRTAVATEAATDGEAGEAEECSHTTLLDIFSFQEAAEIKEAEACLLDRTQLLALSLKAIPVPEWEMVSDHRVLLKTRIGQSDTELNTKVRKLLSEVNTALFKLMNAGAKSHGSIRLQDAVVHVVRSLVSVMREHHEKVKLSQPLKELVKISLMVRFEQSDRSSHKFDLELKVELKEGGFPAFPDCLPVKAAQVYSALMSLKDDIIKALQELPTISDAVDQLLDEAKGFYELAPEAASTHGMSMMEIVKSSKAVATNLDSIFDANQLFAAMGDHVKRIVDDLDAAKPAVEELLQKEMAICPTDLWCLLQDLEAKGFARSLLHKQVWRGNSVRSLLHKQVWHGNCVRSLLHKQVWHGNSARSLLHKQVWRGNSVRSLLHKQVWHGNYVRSLLHKQVWHGNSVRSLLHKEVWRGNSVRSLLHKQVWHSDFVRSLLHKQVWHGNLLRSFLHKQVWHVNGVRSLLHKQVWHGNSVRSLLNEQVWHGNSLRSLLHKQVWHGNCVRSLLNKQVWHGNSVCPLLHKQVWHGNCVRPLLHKQVWHGSFVRSLLHKEVWHGNCMHSLLYMQFWQGNVVAIT
eukprot:gene17044-23337_t